jgi:hypothetical protein
MLVLVATTDPYGVLDNDVSTAFEGELVVPSVLDCPDRECTICRRAWHGLASQGLTTTAMVAARDGVTEAQLRRAIHDWLDGQGTIDEVVQATEDGCYEVNGITFDDPVMAVDDLVEAHLHEIREVCEHFEPGTIVSRLDTLVSPRVLRRAA